MNGFCFVQKELIRCLKSISTVQSKIQIGVGEVGFRGSIASFFHTAKGITTSGITYIHDVQLIIPGRDTSGNNRGRLGGLASDTRGVEGVSQQVITGRHRVDDLVSENSGLRHYTVEVTSPVLQACGGRQPSAIYPTSPSSVFDTHRSLSNK